MEPREPTSADRLKNLRRQLHAYPELSGEEAGTAACLREFMMPCKPARLLEGLGEHGFAAVFESPEPEAGPTVALRAELDALPISESGTIPHISTRQGIAHLCGHDGHLAMICGLALTLKERPLKRGRLVLVFQSAEETGQGARAITLDPRWQNLGVDYVFALHNLPGYPFGQVLLKAGSFTAGSVGLVARLKGRTSHAAYPERGLSPAAAMSRLVSGLVGLAADVEAHGDLALVTVVHARLGEVAFGTTPGEAEIMATLRADEEQTLAVLRARALEMVNREAALDGLQPSVSWVEEFPVTENDDLAVAAAEQAADNASLNTAVPHESPFRWSEDFGWFTRQCHGALIGLGSGLEQPELHAPDFDFPDELTSVGVRYYEALIAEMGLR